MECVILAAGRGHRLNGLAAPFHKPLMVVNGKPMIVHVVEVAFASVIQHVVVVCAPTNVGPIIDLLGANDLLAGCTFVVQPQPTGPGAAFTLGARAITSRQVLVLMGDNIMHVRDVRPIADDGDVPGRVIIGVRGVSSSGEASRFTRIRPDYSTVEGTPAQSDELWDDGLYRIWCGPLVVPRDSMVAVLAGSNDGAIGPHLCSLGSMPILREVDVIDIGVPTEVM